MTNDAEIAGLIAWAKQQPKGPVRHAAVTLSGMLEAYREMPDRDIWGRDKETGVLVDIIADALKELQRKVAEARRS